MKVGANAKEIIIIFGVLERHKLYAIREFSHSHYITLD
jgi:hypothetical protein